ncbi:MAG: UTP--glucose-1-phosphate uridylyltransferase GalU [Pseudomonadota bacterium]
MNAFKPVRKAVFPVAGLGTRFLPATKAIPKEMLTVVDKPTIQYVVDEAREAGIEHFVFVTGRNKAVIEDHFDFQVELNKTLTERGKTDVIDMLKSNQLMAGQTSFTRQQEPLGLGHAVWCARDIVGDEPFALLLPDMIMQSPKGCLSSMVDVYNNNGGNVIAVEEVADSETHKYGIVAAGEPVGDGFKIEGMVEKPPQGTAPSNLMINGRYILQPEIFGLLENQRAGAGGEIQITDAMLRLAEKQDFFGFRFNGRTFDTGSKEGFIAANIAFALWRPDIEPIVRPMVEDLMKEVQPHDRRETNR